MKNPLKRLKIICTLVVLLLIAGIGFIGYNYYKKQESAKPTPTLESSPPKAISTPTKIAQDIQLSDNQINWANMLDSLQEQPSTTPPIKKPKTLQAKKPYLVIIMDDMAYPNQVRDLQKLQLPITPSFFPVSKDSPDTAKLAKNLPFYMVHLPLEAQNNQVSNQYWIKSQSTIESIRAHIATIKKDFPKLAFVNNHTGSKFTANYNDMLKLLYVLNIFDIDFVDSRTTKNTAAPEIYKKSARPLLYRDIFLDNEPNQDYITKQIKQAINIAKKKGYAIAICHPHQATFAALQKTKEILLEEVNLVYLKDLPIAKNRPPLKISMQEIIDSALPLIPQVNPADVAKSSILDITSFTKETKDDKQDSRIDQSIFQEAGDNQNLEDIDDCEQNEIEAFISGCPPNGQKNKKQKGFIDLQWKRKDAKEQLSSDTLLTQKPKDFLEMDQ